MSTFPGPLHHRRRRCRLSLVIDESLREKPQNINNYARKYCNKLEHLSKLINVVNEKIYINILLVLLKKNSSSFVFAIKSFT
jgi:hypothetical protein